MLWAMARPRQIRRRLFLLSPPWLSQLPECASMSRLSSPHLGLFPSHGTRTPRRAQNVVEPAPARERQRSHTSQGLLGNALLGSVFTSGDLVRRSALPDATCTLVRADGRTHMSQTIMDSESAVRQRYSAAAKTAEKCLCSSVGYDPRLLEAIPTEIIEKDYGCGNPTLFVRSGDVVV